MVKLWIYILCIQETIFHVITPLHCINKSRLRQNGWHLPDGIFKCIFLNENVWIEIKIKITEIVPKDWINNMPALVQIMAWHRPGYKPLSEPMMVRLLTHICVAQPQWVNLIICVGWYKMFKCNVHHAPATIGNIDQANRAQGDLLLLHVATVARQTMWNQPLII